MHTHEKYRNEDRYYNNIIIGVRAIAYFQYSAAWYHWEIGICVIKRFPAIFSSMEWVNHPLWYPFTRVANKFFYSFFYFFSIFSYCFIFNFIVIPLFKRINLLWNHIDSLDSCPVYLRARYASIVLICGLIQKHFASNIGIAKSKIRKKESIVWEIIKKKRTRQWNVDW